jgi:hypothetical protein
MNRALKTLLIWLLALALPMQGHAAAIMFTCQTTLELPSHSMTQAMHVDHVMDADDMHHHDHASVPQTSNADLHHAGPDKHHHHSSCSTCAVCCIGMAVMPAALDWQPPYTGAELAPASPAVSFAGHIPAGPDRPPRSILV